MSALDTYKAGARERDYSAEWAALLGQRYHGGGGGTGYLVSVKLVGGEAAPTIYHQYSDGAKNYHQAPASLLSYLEVEIKERFPEILAGALTRQADDLRRLAKAAADEHADLMAAAGLPVPAGGAA